MPRPLASRRYYLDLPTNTSLLAFHAHLDTNADSTGTIITTLVDAYLETDS